MYGQQNIKKVDTVMIRQKVHIITIMLKWVKQFVLTSQHFLVKMRKANIPRNFKIIFRISFVSTNGWLSLLMN